jgi:hypothetical protein
MILGAGNGGTQMAKNDEIPSDDEVLAVIRGSDEGITPSALVLALCETGHTEANTIRAIQRVFDRGLVCLGDGARLVEPPERVAA